jgi:hypothetical protein
MKVSGQLHALAALLPGKEPPVQIGEGWEPKSVWRLWMREKKVAFPEIEPGLSRL